MKPLKPCSLAAQYNMVQAKYFCHTSRMWPYVHRKVDNLQHNFAAMFCQGNLSGHW